jgi:hypothetical protein
MNTAVLQRELRRLVRSRILWALAAGMGFMMMGARNRDAPVCGALVAGAAGCMALYWAHRSMQAELEEETIEHLGTLPLSPLSVVFQVGTGAATAALMYSLVALLVACPRPLCSALDTWARGAAVAYALGWMGAMGAFRYGETTLGSITAMGPMTLLLCSVVGAQSAILNEFPTFWSILATLMLGGGTTLICYGVWKARGGQWVESILPKSDAPARRARVEGEPPEEITPAPDWSSPVFWYELCHNRFWMTVYALAPSAFFLMFGMLGMVNASLQHAIFSISMTLGTFYVLLTASGRAAQHRRTGLWTDLAVTPMSTWRIVVAQLAGMLSRSALILVCWSVSAWVAAGSQAEHVLLGVTVGVILGWGVAIMCGYLAGACTTGWKAGLLGLFYLYLTMSIVPFTSFMLATSIFGYTSRVSDYFIIPVLGAWTFMLFYACVRRVAAHQA